MEFRRHCPCLTNFARLSRCCCCCADLGARVEQLCLTLKLFLRSGREILFLRVYILWRLRIETLTGVSGKRAGVEHL